MGNVLTCGTRGRCIGEAYNRCAAVLQRLTAVRNGRIYVIELTVLKLGVAVHRCVRENLSKTACGVNEGTSVVGTSILCRLLDGRCCSLGYNEGAVTDSLNLAVRDVTNTADNEHKGCRAGLNLHVLTAKEECGGTVHIRVNLLTVNGEVIVILRAGFGILTNVELTPLLNTVQLTVIGTECARACTRIQNAAGLGGIQIEGILSYIKRDVARARDGQLMTVQVEEVVKVGIRALHRKGCASDIVIQRYGCAGGREHRLHIGSEIRSCRRSVRVISGVTAGFGYSEINLIIAGGNDRFADHVFGYRKVIGNIHTVHRELPACAGVLIEGVPCTGIRISEGRDNRFAHGILHGGSVRILNGCLVPLGRYAHCKRGNEHHQRENENEEFFAVFHTFLLRFDNLELYTYIVAFFSQNFH